jgi:ribosomal protein S12 methylthiotransferase accessory factor
VEPADSLLVAFKSHLRVKEIPADAICLLSERGAIALSGSSISRLAPLLDGTRSIAQVRYELAPGLSGDEVDQMLARLAEAGVIKTFPAGNGNRLPHQADKDSVAYWDLAGLDSVSATAALASPGVEIIVTGSPEPGVAAACQETGLAVHDPGAGNGPGAALSLVLCDDYLDPALGQVNADHLASGRPWLLAKPAGAAVWIGPVFQPGAGPCWMCLAKRLAGNRIGEFLTRQDPVAGPRPVSLRTTRAAGIHLAVLEAAKWLAGFRYEGQQDLCMIDTLTLRNEHHRVAQRPQCPACGDQGLVAAQVRRPVQLQQRAAARESGSDEHGNGQRTLRMDQVLGRYRHLIDPVTGIVPELRRHPQCPGFLNSYQSGRNRAMTESSMVVLKAGLRSHSGGKGATELEAQVGALCEAVERYCGTRDGDEPVVRDSYRGLGSQAVHPDTCQLFHERQFADRARWNAECSPFHGVPEPFDEREVTEWTPVWSLLSGTQRLLPTALLYYNPDPGRKQTQVRADSNGNAAGASLEDAVLHGFCELVERDAVALWWYNRTRHPAVDLESFDDPWAAGLPGRYRGLCREVWVLDVTSDLGIPAMAAVSRRTDKAAEDIMLGFGAHFDPHIALRRALTELGQLLPAAAGAGPSGTGYGSADPHLLSWWTRATTRSEPYLVPDPEQSPRTAADYRYTPSQDLNVSRACTVASRAGLDVMVLDQTRPDIGMPVVKVISPGLRHFWPRFAPGRLFDVPVRLGRLTRKTAYEDLNPVPIYL